MKKILNKLFLDRKDVVFLMLGLFLTVGYGVYKVPYLIQNEPKLLEIYTERDMYILDLTNYTLYIESIGQKLNFKTLDELLLYTNHQTVRDLKADR